MELWIWCYRLTAFRLTWGNKTGAVFQYQQDKYIHVLIIRKKRHTNSLLKSGTRHRCGSTQVSTVLRKSVRFFINKYIVIKIKLSKLRSGQYPVWMTQKPWNPGDFGELKSKKFPNREHAADPPPPPPSFLEACNFGARLGNRSVSILDPHLRQVFGFLFTVDF